MSHMSSATVKRSSQKTCFVNLSSDLARVVAPRSQNLPQTVVLQLEWPDKTVFVSWSGDVAVDRNKGFMEASSSVIEIGTKFADSMGLDEGQQILVSPVESVLSCTRMGVDPVSADDWEILELHAGYIENQLLNQVRIVCPSEVLPVWIKKNMCIWIKVVSIEPTAPCAKLEEFTEVVVSPRQRSGNSSSDLRQDAFTGQTSSTTRVGASTASSSTGLVNGGKVSSLHFSESHASDQRTSMTSMVYSYLRTLFYDRDSENVSHSERGDPGRETEMVNSDASSSSTTPCTSGDCHSDALADCFENQTINMCLRTQCMDRTSICDGISDRSCKPDRYCICQPSTVFVNVASLPREILKSWQECVTYLPDEDTVIVRIVQIQRLLSPREQAEQISRSRGAVAMPEESGGSGTQPTPVTGENRNPSSQSTSTQSEQDIPLRSMARLVITSGSPGTPRLCPTCAAYQVLPGHIVMSKELSQQLGVQCPSLVRLKSVSYSASDIQGLVLHPLDSCLHKVRDMNFRLVVQGFQDWLCSVSTNECPVVATDGMLIVFSVDDDSLEFLLSVLSHQGKSSDAKETLLYHHLCPRTLETVTVVLGELGVLSQVAQDQSGSKPKCTIDQLGGLKDAFTKCQSHLLIALGQQPLAKHIAGDACSGLRSGALLICGSGTGSGIGCGKTSLAHALCHQLQQWPTCAHVRIVDCVPFRGKRVETIQKHLQKVFTDAAWHQPSVILLDDLDQVISAPSPSQEIGGEALYRTRLAQVFKDLIANEITNGSKVTVIVTSRSQDSLHPSLLTSHGSHVFQCRVQLQPPDSGQRQEILSLIVKKRFPGMDASKNGDLSALIKRTEGFSPRDLNALTDRAAHVMTVKQMKASQDRPFQFTEISLEDFETALEGFKPAALRGVNLHTAGELGWSDVGGLCEVKNVLKETLLWPTKYPSLFYKCPLRLRSGILLYGPPGTGKTLLAGVVAKECGLNFISIKGPELLSKYIGASEQAVRDMFTRAQTAKPCVLFFDEFDSLAPRRGHDSTGVTDRVVNQLLTQLDGVEGLERVYVLAATSRPDLIDPALLRPGRLDKCLYCGIPNKVDRPQVLRALAKNLLLHDDVVLENVAETCENFTGADLKALLYNAQLEAIHRSSTATQLYGTVFTRAKAPDQQGDEDKSGQRSPLQTAGSQGIIYIPSLEKGQKQLSADEATTLKAEIAVIEENLQDGGRWRRQHRAAEKKLLDAEVDKKNNDGRVKIKQSDLIIAAGSMGPSVSRGEQFKYQKIYESFVNSRGGAFSQATPGQGRATLS